MRWLRRNLGALISTILILTVAVIGTVYLQYRFSLGAVSTDSNSVEFVINSGDKPTDIAHHLQSAGLIHNASSFLTYVTWHGLRGKLQAGSYLLRPSYSTEQVVGIITHGLVHTNLLTIPEGNTLAQIRKLAVAKGINATDFDQALQGNYGKDFLVGRPPNVTLEGYLFPDSYQVDARTTAASLIGAMIDNFDQKVTVDLRNAYTAQGLTLHQGVTLASIVEKEVPNASDRAIVAGIFLHRIRLGMPLESDVTVHYAADSTGQPFSTGLDSPYNTYQHKGLPPGPICSPGLSALKAVAAPQSSDYLYFVAGKDGITHYAKTFAEHQQNVQKYLQ